MRIAIIGGIGSGKSTVLDIVRNLGYPSLSADEMNRELLEDPQYIRLLGAAFPDVVVDGRVDKDSLRNQIFSDKTKRLMLNNIAHPMIKRKIASIEKDPLFVEVPLICESGMEKEFDELILVSATLKKRIKRLKNRPEIKKLTKKIINSQISQKKLKSLATIVIDNNGTYEDLEKSVKKIVKCLFPPKS